MHSPEQLQKLYQYAYTLTANEADAYDLLQSALERFIKLDTQPDAPDAYLRRMMRNTHIDALRRAQKLPMDTFDESCVTADLNERSLEEMIMDADEVSAVWILLKPAEREILHLWAMEDLSMSEIAAELDMPRGTVLSIVHRMRARLRAQSPAEQARIKPRKVG